MSARAGLSPSLRLPLFAVAGALSFALGLGLCQVYLANERVELAYGLKRLSGELDEATAHRDKLLLERDNLASPYRLRQKAREYGLRPAEPGQIRRGAPDQPDVSEGLADETANG